VLETNTGDGSGPIESAAPLTDALTAAGWHLGAMFRLPRVGWRGGLLLGAFALLAWAASGVYKVGPDEQGVVLRFGRWISTDQPGLHYHLPYPISTVLLPRMTAVNELRSNAGLPGAGTSRMLTGDENLVEADYSVLWKISDAGAFLFRVQDPEATIRMAAEMAVREVVGRNPIQAALSDRRQQIADAAEDELQRLLDAYGAGIRVIQLQLQRVDPPSAVIDAFNDVQRARADQVRSRNEAEAYRNDVLPHARGEADHILQEAEAYRTQVVEQAQGEVDAFLAAYQAYQRAPEVFSWRVYLDSMDELLRRASRVVVDASGKEMTGVVPYMPLGEPPAQLLGGPPAKAAPAATPARRPEVKP
jgi:membrane protease subunit HflK